MSQNKPGLVEGYLGLSRLEYLKLGTALLLLMIVSTLSFMDILLRLGYTGVERGVYAAFLTSGMALVALVAGHWIAKLVGQ